MKRATTFCTRHGRPKDRGYCRACKTETERRRYAKNPAQEQNRKRIARTAGSNPVSEVVVVRRAMPDEICEHDLAKRVTGLPEMFWCADCGDYLDSDSMETIEEALAEKKIAAQQKVAAKSSPRPGARNRTAAAASGGTEDGADHLPGAGLQTDAVGQAEQRPHNAVVRAPRGAKGSGAKSHTPEELPSVTDAHGRSVAIGTVLAGPYAEMACPFVTGDPESPAEESTLMCVGHLRPFQTIISSLGGNHYFYRCDTCRCQVIIAPPVISSVSA